ncbi:AAA family ATPase [Bacteroides rodentium]|uniref:AAA family ATPase n=1 Tax=Bacteroides rodentium TaxID=691816 RepID=UPI0004718839|nr:ATP-binding protein [Bacteroides rodentium]
MATITQIEIDGFKAFPTNFTLSLGTGQNLLLYGENGSGKSSLYYAIHALMQSVLKDDKGAKYFKPGDVNGADFIANNEHLINIFRFDEAKANTYTPYIRITFDDNKVWRLDNSGLSSENGGDESEIRMLNKDSAFINHSYISRFHAARNSEEIDLWNVFYKDILPFHIPAGTTQFLADFYDEIVSDCNAGIGLKDNSIQNKISTFNGYLNSSINRINTKVSSIYNDNFKNEDDKSLEIKLMYYSDDDQENKLKEHFYLYYGNVRNNQIIDKTDLYSPRIGIEIKENGILIHKPQSHFNEAKLTAIALSVRFAAMTTNAITTGSFLALDDMLISLDMSNRMKVIKYLLNKIAPKYKLYVFTHDRLLFTSFKKSINSQKQQNGWLCGGIYMHDRDNSTDFKKCKPYPVFIEEKDSELKAKEYYIMHDYPACGQQLRKWCEDILSNLYPDTLLKKRDPRTGKTDDTSLNDRIVYLNDYCKKESIRFDEFNDLKIYKDNLLNTVSHYDVSSPIYGSEILSIMRILSKLDQIKTNKKQIDVNPKLGIELTADDGNPVTICIDIRSKKLSIIEYEGNKNISYFTKCVVYKIIENGTSINISPNVTYDSIYEAYWYYCGRYGCDSTINLLDAVKDHGIFIKDKH